MCSSRWPSPPGCCSVDGHPVERCRPGTVESMRWRTVSSGLQPNTVPESAEIQTPVVREPVKAVTPCPCSLRPGSVVLADVTGPPGAAYEVGASLRRRATAGVPVCLAAAHSSQVTRSRGCAALPGRACNLGSPRARGRPRLAGRPCRTCSRTDRSADHDTCSRSGPNARRCSAPTVTEAAGRLRGTDSAPASGTPCRTTGSRRGARDRGASNCPCQVKCSCGARGHV
jgi:hypothetical protein